MAGFDGDRGQDGAAARQVGDCFWQAPRRAGPLDLDNRHGTWFPPLMIAGAGPLCKPRAGRL
jgi:hypothetical protein